ncbi:putative late blight resistance protein homolog R1B-16 isoform X4 [Nicotiana tabacum]|uniref:Late blight resistance protein homolog R1B-16 isoform X4 n=1 Tax=Nicotiana tabacum TaxID=4097 RepID=A0AC58SP10_TOBAC
MIFQDRSTRVTSLMGTIHLISQSNLDLQDGHKDHLKLLYEKVSSLLEFLDTNSDDEPMKDLQEKVKDLAHEVEDKVESHIQREAQKKFLKMLQRVFHLPTKAHERLLKNLQRDIEAIDSIKEELFKQRENNNMQAGNSSLGGSNSLGSHVSTLENNMVGYNDEQASMLRQLTGDSRQLEVISIVGMGGIGKSTFAKRVFSDPSVVGFFDVRGWITMSKDYSIRKMLLSLLQDAGVDLDKVSDEEQADHLEESDEETVDHLQKINNALADRLQKSLKGTLSSKRTLDEWRKVANSVSSLVNLDDYQRCSGVLALSYNHLPSHLKACFLYFGVFPKATDISVKKLIRLWVAEGLLELKRLEGLEKVAAYLLHDLIDKSLIIVSRRSFDGKIKTCRIHDLLHDLCWREAESDSILYVVNDVPYGGPRRYFPQGRRWVSLHLAGGYYPTLFSALSYSKTRSVHFYADPVYNLQLEHFKLLRVLDLEATEFQYGFPREILRLVCLRYLVMKIDEISEHIPISNLQNLQTLVIFTTSRKGFINLRDGIWDMSQLRHLNCSRIFLYPPPNVSPNEVEYPSLENLQSVCGLSSSCCTKEIFKGIKKVKKMGISCDSYSESEWLANLKYLLELEALSIASSSYYGNVYSDFRLPCPGSFPPNLKKLTLCCTRLSWEDMTIISKLPKLEVLQLKEDDFARSLSVGERVWEVTEMGFPELKFLLLEKLILDYWRATDDYFPCLEHVIIKNCSLLKEIPQGFADSMTLKLIMLQGCSPSVVTSAEWIQREQLESSGTDMLRVYAVDTRDSDQDY